MKSAAPERFWWIYDLQTTHSWPKDLKTAECQRWCDRQTPAHYRSSHASAVHQKHDCDCWRPVSLGRGCVCHSLSSSQTTNSRPSSSRRTPSRSAASASPTALLIIQLSALIPVFPRLSQCTEDQITGEKSPRQIGWQHHRINLCPHYCMSVFWKHYPEI